MRDKLKRRFVIDWVLINELALGPAPRAERHLDRLEGAGINAIFSLCSSEEAPPPAGLSDRFPYRRLVLPDHRSGRLPQLIELRSALDILSDMHLQHGAVFVHCVASMERSPLVCLAWLITKHKRRPEQALDYLMQVHPGTNPLPGQLALLRELS